MQRVLIALMIALVAFVAMAYISLYFLLTPPAPSYDVPSDLKIGMTAADLGRLHPDLYSVQKPDFAKSYDRRQLTLPAQENQLKHFTGRLFKFKMEGIWDKVLNIWFVDGKIAKMNTEVEKCSVCD